MKYKLLTYGCQMNEYDSEVIAAAVEGLGAVSTKNESEADLIIFNTCCVRDNADQKVYGRLGQCRQLKKMNPDLILVVCGCLAQKDRESLLERFPWVDLVVGTQNLSELVGLIEEVRFQGPKVRVEDEGAQFLMPEKRRGGVTGYVTISIGCDCFCTYCIVPYVRGRLQSRPVNEILREVEGLVEAGYKEIFLLGQNVNTYGEDLPGSPTFKDLLTRIDGVPGVGRIRFTSPHPKDFSDELIEALGKLKKVCESIHLPLQAGSDSVLKRMNRRYDKKRFMEIVEKLRSAVPGVALSTDLIVGFPGESDEEFEEGLDFIRRVGFDQAFMFAYSVRTGTAAARMDNHLPHEVKMERLYRLIDMQNDVSRQKNEALQGSEAEVLVERISKKDSSRVTGRTRTNKVVNFPGDESLIGKIMMVKLEKAYTWGFTGSVAG